MNWLRKNAVDSDIDAFDRLSGTPDPTFWSKWFGGVLVPFGVVIYALVCIATKTAILPGQSGSNLPLEGPLAVWLGIAWLSGGLFLHFHFFWPTLKWLGIFTDVGKSLSLLAFIGCGGYVAWSIVMH